MSMIPEHAHTSLLPDSKADVAPVPVIYTSEQRRTILQRSLQLLLETNHPPGLFRHHGRLVRVVQGSDGPCIERVSPRWLYKRLVELADWIAITVYGPRPSSPPQAIVQAILEEPDDGFPALDAVAGVPVFGCGWIWVECPGYDPRTRTYLADNCGLPFPEPGMRDVATARSLLLEAVCDFPFADDASRAHAVALFLLPFIRGALGDVPTPLHLIEAPAPGSGKGRLADLVSIVATGTCCRPTSLSSSKSENAKKLSAILLSGAPIILLDNLPQERILNDSVLASVLTSPAPTERLLGSNSMLRLRNGAVWVATANNPRCSPELARRSVRIRLDPPCDRPWLRKDFVHADLLGWARARRGELMAACTCLVKAWVDEGCPGWFDRTLGSFEAWSSALGGILAQSGVTGFLDNLEDSYRDCDAESEEWRAALQVWWRRFGSRSLRASDVCELCIAKGLLEEVIGLGAARSQSSRMGRALQRHVGRVFGAFKLVRDHSTLESSARYALREVRPLQDSPVPLAESVRKVWKA